MRPTILEAVILAAGNGSRLRLPDGAPKPLATVGGFTLINRIVRSVERSGVETVHIVTGHGADRLRSGAFPESPRCNVRWVHNLRYAEANGLSLLAAEKSVSGPFLLLMADHLFEQCVLDDFLAACRQDPGCSQDDAQVVMAVDFKVDQVLDLDDATKVRTVGSRLVAIGKSVQPFNAIDTGMFVCGADVFTAIRTSAATGDSSLSAAVGTLANQGCVRTLDIGDGRWIDIDTPAALRTAERMLNDGMLSS